MSQPNPPTVVDLAAVRRRLDWLRANADQCERSPGQVSLSGYVAACIDSSKDVPDLLAEVERLRAVLGKAGA
jgi:hypothetical protein